MLKILLPIDGSENALRAVRHAVTLAANKAEIECQLLNVQTPMPGRIHGYKSREEIADMERAEAEQVLRPAQEILDAAGISYSATYLEGEVAQAITDYATNTRCDVIVMGMRGMGIVVGPLVMGSVTSKVVHAARVPVTLVK